MRYLSSAKRSLVLGFIFSQLYFPLLAHPLVKGKPIWTSCWRMVSNRPFIAGVGEGIEWNLLGTCHISLSGKYTIKNVQVIPNNLDKGRKSFVVDGLKYGQTKSLKPYQNPAGVWLSCVYENQQKNSSICAINTWFQHPESEWD